MFDFVEKALDEISVAIEVRAESWYVLAVRHWFDVRPRSSLIEAPAQFVAVVGPVGQKDLPLGERAQHVVRAAPIVRLAFGQLQGDRQALVRPLKSDPP